MPKAGVAEALTPAIAQFLIISAHYLQLPWYKESGPYVLITFDESDNFKETPC
jgi:hypothetical protein